MSEDANKKSEQNEKRQRDPRGRWVKGSKGGPGRKPGPLARIDFLKCVADEAKKQGADVESIAGEVAMAMVERAKQGDTAAAKLVLDRLCGPVRDVPLVGIQMGVGEIDPHTGEPRPPGPPIPPTPVLAQQAMEAMHGIAALHGRILDEQGRSIEHPTDDDIARLDPENRDAYFRALARLGPKRITAQIREEKSGTTGTGPVNQSPGGGGDAA